MLNRRKLLILSIAVLLLVFFGLAGCRASTPGNGGATAETTTPATQPAATLTPTSIPTETPQPRRVVLLAPQGADSEQQERAAGILSELAEGAGLRFEVLNSASAAELGDVEVLAALPPDPGLGDLASAAPDVQFLGIGIGGLEPAANLSLIEPVRSDRQAFLAGYIAAAITEDWRIGAISPQGTPEGQVVQQAFANGARFFCGLCRPAYPPFYQYPQFSEVAVGAGEAEQTAAADFLVDQAVGTVYLPPGLGDEVLAEYLSQAQVNVIGARQPSASIQNRWVASIRADVESALQQAWMDVIQGQGGQRWEVPLILSDVNDTLLSPGRQRLIEETLADLMGGFIGTGVNPQTGEPEP